MSTLLFFQSMVMFIWFSQGSPKMILSFPHFIVWNSSLWMILPILMNKMTECYIVPASFRDPSTLLTSSGFLSCLRGILILCVKL